MKNFKADINDLNIFPRILNEIKNNKKTLNLKLESLEKYFEKDKIKILYSWKSIKNIFKEREINPNIFS